MKAPPPPNWIVSWVTSIQFLQFGIFNNNFWTVIARYLASNISSTRLLMTNRKVCEWKGCRLLKIASQWFSYALREAAENLRQKNRRLGRDSNPGPPEYEAGTIINTQQLSTHVSVFHILQEGLPRRLLTWGTWIKMLFVSDFSEPHPSRIH